MTKDRKSTIAQDGYVPSKVEKGYQPSTSSGKEQAGHIPTTSQGGSGAGTPPNQGSGGKK